MKHLSSLLFLAIISFSTISLQAVEEEKVCRALALRGGGTKGAYEVGVLKGLMKHLKPEEYAYDVVVGVSVGAINAAVIAVYPQGQEKDAVAELEEQWQQYLCQDLWSFWPYTNVLAGIYKEAFLDDTKLATMAHLKFSNRTFQRRFSWQSVDLNTGNVIIFDETIPDEYRVKAIKASASLPGFFSPVEIKNLRLIDGGIFENLDLAEAIVKCRETGAKDNNIIVDIILCFDRPPEVPHWSVDEAKYKSSWDMVNRKQSFKNIYYYKEDVERVIKGFPHIKFRYIVQPSEVLPALYVPIYSQIEDIKFQLALGEKDAEDLFKSNNLSNVGSFNLLLKERHQMI